MNISWNGFGSFTFTGKPSDGEVTLVTDPYENSTGLRFPRTQKASIVVVSQDSEYASNGSAILQEGEKMFFTVNHPGEYEVKGISVHGIACEKKDGSKHTIYKIIIEDVKIGFLGSLDRVLKEKEIEVLGDIDVLIVPVGGQSVMDAKLATEVVSQIEPRIVIPSYSHTEGAKGGFAGVEQFCKEIGFPAQDVNKAKITKSSLPDEDMQVIVLSR
ncbi:MBL fold metallo-hydrolase [Patescibacteria group bacterium]|nr:MBL fold metallo-hydrolase [Patescibacteria group bacterium]